MGREDEMIKERMVKIDEMRKAGINPYPQVSLKKDFCGDLQEEYKKLENEKFGKDALVAGRVMSIRDIGKIIFVVIQDMTGHVQLVLQEEKTDKKYIDLLKKFSDMGDFISAGGKVFRTKRGELSILVEDLSILTKSINPLPDKFQGLQDKEDRYRKRYLDLITNPEAKKVFENRIKIIDTVKEFLKEDRFMEVETPLLQTLYGGASARPFMTHLNALDIELYLAISPELYLKRLVAGGFERVFTICKNFRNEGIDAFHNPEFTMLEFYYAYQNYEKLMQMTEDLINRLKKKLNLGDEIEYQGKKISLKTPFKRIRFKDLILEKAGIDIDKANTYDKLKKEILAKKLKDVDIAGCKHYGALLDEMYKRVARPGIVQPTFLTHYPVEMIALAKRNETDPRKINTFQLLVDGAEIVKAYDELNDPIDQENRLKEQASLLAEGSEDAMPLDEDFINALKVGMPPTAGYGMGIDRLTMLLTNSLSIRDVILFPFMKPEVKEAKEQDKKVSTEVQNKPIKTAAKKKR